TPTGMLMTGQHGASTGFHTLIRYILNVHAVFPTSKAEEDALIEHDEQVFAWNDLRELSRCVDWLQHLLQKSLENLPGIARNQGLRNSTWHPAWWQSIQQNGLLLDCDALRLQYFDWNVFTSPMEAFPVDLLSNNILEGQGGFMTAAPETSAVATCCHAIGCELESLQEDERWSSLRLYA
ncbi:hypothetical protein FRC10_007771, partial [Ceratobasidium sp. 414]